MTVTSTRCIQAIKQLKPSRNPTGVTVCYIANYNQTSPEFVAAVQAFHSSPPVRGWEHFDPESIQYITHYRNAGIISVNAISPVALSGNFTTIQEIRAFELRVRLDPNITITASNLKLELLPLVVAKAGALEFPLDIQSTSFVAGSFSHAPPLLEHPWPIDITITAVWTAILALILTAGLLRKQKLTSFYFERVRAEQGG
jgi:hypothetical protein